MGNSGLCQHIAHAGQGQHWPCHQAPFRGGAPFSRTSLRASEVWTHPYSQHHLGRAVGVSEMIFIILLLKQFQFMPGCAVGSLGVSAMGKLGQKNFPNGKDKVSRGDTSSNVGFMPLLGTCLPSHSQSPVLCLEQAAQVWGLACQAVSQHEPHKLFSS